MLNKLNIKKSAQGFTLIEVITVIVVLSVLAALGGSFVVESTKSYQSTQIRSRLINTGRQAVERMSRQLRAALPYSVRLTNGNACLEFMPIASGGSYSTSVPDALNGVATTSSIIVSPHTIDFGGAPDVQYVTIGAMDAAEIYGTNPASRAGLASRTDTVLTLSSAKRWQRNSVNQRFYLLNAPQAFCIVANQLRFYSNQDATSAEVNLASTHSLLADNVTATTPFTLIGSAENRNAVAQFNISFAYKNESIAFNHSVMIRNVP